MCFQDDSNKRASSSETSEVDEIIRGEISGIPQKAAKTEDKVEEFLKNHEGDEKLQLK